MSVLKWVSSKCTAKLVLNLRIMFIKMTYMIVMQHLCFICLLLWKHNIQNDILGSHRIPQDWLFDQNWGRLWEIWATISVYWHNIYKLRTLVSIIAPISSSHTYPMFLLFFWCFWSFWWTQMSTCVKWIWGMSRIFGLQNCGIFILGSVVGNFFAKISSF